MKNVTDEQLVRIRTYLEKPHLFLNRQCCVFVWELGLWEEFFLASALRQRILDTLIRNHGLADEEASRVQHYLLGCIVGGGHAALIKMRTQAVELLRHYFYETDKYTSIMDEHGDTHDVARFVVRQVDDRVYLILTHYRKKQLIDQDSASIRSWLLSDNDESVDVDEFFKFLDDTGTRTLLQHPDDELVHDIQQCVVEHLILEYLPEDYD